MTIRLRCRVLACACLAVGLSLCGCNSDEEYECRRFRSEEGVEVVLYLANGWEVGQAISYAVRDGKDEIPMTYIGNLAKAMEPPEMRLLQSGKGRSSVIGVVRCSQPAMLLLAYDRATKESWPGSDGSHDTELRQRLHTVLAKECPGLVLHKAEGI